MKKRIFNLLLSISMLIAMFSVNVGTVNAATVSVPTGGVTETYDLASGNVTIASEGVYVIYQSNAKTMYTITINSNATVYLNGVNIEVEFTSADVLIEPINEPNPININGAYTVHLYLVDGSINTLASQGVAVPNNNFRSGSSKAAVHVPSLSTLTIYGNTGVLNATGAEGYSRVDNYAHGGGGAGIGGNGGYYYSNNVLESYFKNAEQSGTIIINGGVINATGGANAGYHGDGGSGIGAGGKRFNSPNGISGPVNIAGGTVIATGGNGKESGYGIGGDLTFQNGSLIAKSGTYGPQQLRSAIEKTPVSFPTSYQWRVNAGGTFVTFPTTEYTYSSDQTYVEFEAFDQAPILSAGSMTRTSDTTATIKFTSNEVGSYYYSVVTDGASVPTIDTSSSGITCTTAETTITNPIGLSAGAKDIYIVVKDTAGNISNALKIDIAEYTNTAYKVEHYQENLSGGYTLKDTDNLTGTTGSSITTNTKTYTGFSENTTYTGRVASGTIQTDGSTVLKLYYDRNSYTVTFRDHNESVLKTESVKYEAGASAPTSPTRTGYTFTGWDTAFTTVTTNLSVKAAYSANTNTAYKVEHYQELLTGGYTLKDTENLTGTTGSSITTNTKTYTGFSENTTYTGRVASGTIQTDGSTVLKLYYDRNSYTVTFRDHNESVLKTESVKYEAGASAPTSPTRTGYTFSAWDTAFTTVTTNLSVKAAYSANTNTAYKVEHYQELLTGGYTLKDTENLTGTTGSSITTNTKTYTGFSENTTYTGRVASGTIQTDGSTVLKLYYDRNSYTVTFRDHNESVLKTESVKYEAGASAPTSPTRTGYTFTGWDKAFTTMTSDLSVKAAYSANTNTAYKVEHYQERLTGGYERKDTENLTGTTGSSITTNTKTYTGFSENTTYTGRVASGTIQTDGSTVLKLYYDRNSYTVTFRDHNESVLKTESVKYEAGASAPTSPTRTGYTFSAWDTAFVSVLSDMTIKARFEIMKYTVSFLDFNDRVIGSASIVEHGQDTLAPTAPTRFGYVFKGWEKAFNNITSDLVIRAVYTKLNDPIVVIEDKEDFRIEADGLDESVAFTNQERLKDISVELEIVVLEVNDVPTEDKALIDLFVENTLKVDLPKLFVLDISLFKVVGSNRTAIQNAESEITIRFILPEEFRGIEFSVIRVHEGEVEKLEFNYNEETFEVSFKTDKFSTYSLVAALKVDEEPVPVTPLEEVKSDTNTLRNILIALSGLFILIGLFFVIWKKRKQSDEQ